MAWVWDIKVSNADNVERALSELPLQARDEARKGIEKISRNLANKIRAAGRATPKPRGTGPRGGAAATTRARRGLSGGVIAGPHPMLFGSEFGAKGRFGWYAKPRYFHSHARQYRPHLGGGSYWFFKTQEANQAAFDRDVQEIGDNIIRRWSA